MYDKGLFVDWENIDSSWKSLPLITGTGGDMEEEVKAIKIDETYFKTPSSDSSDSQNNSSDLTKTVISAFTRRMESKSYTDALKKSFKYYEESKKREFTTSKELLEGYKDHQDRIAVKKKRRW